MSEDYASLSAVLDEAFRQSTEGKGVERHANGRPFEQQPIIQIGQKVGPGFNLGQVLKKTEEACGMMARGEKSRAVHELLGAIVYAAAAVIIIREK